LDQLRQFCSSAQKSKYQELFADLSDDDNAKSSSNSISSGSNSNKKSSTNVTKKNQTILSKTRSGNTTNKNIESDTESESSDDDIPLTKSKTNARKKRKQPIGSDSDWSFPLNIYSYLCYIMWFICDLPVGWIRLTHLTILSPRLSRRGFYLTWFENPHILPSLYIYMFLQKWILEFFQNFLEAIFIRWDVLNHDPMNCEWKGNGFLQL